MSRREFMKAGLTAAALLPIVGLRPGVARAQDEKLVTELPDQAPMVTALQYVNKSAKPDQNCKLCQFFTPQGDGARGKCQLFQSGVVSAEGWCASWAKKIS
jgi:hypothetical protein